MIERGTLSRGAGEGRGEGVATAAAPTNHVEIVRALVLDVTTCDEPQARLLKHLTALDARQDLASQAAVFEQVSRSVDVQHFWILHRMHRVYADLGRRDLAFLTASLATRICHEPGALFPLLREMFVYHRERGEARAAVEVFLIQAERVPEQPLADRWEIEPLAREIGLSLDPPPGAASPGSRRDRTLYPAGMWTPEVPSAVGGRLPVALARMATPRHRHATVVAELPDAELFIRNNSLVTADRAGRIQLDLSLGPFPKFVRDRVADDAATEQLQLDEAVVLLDPFPPPNLGHFLLDQISRLGLYRRAGAKVSQATVVGPRLVAGFQQEIAARVAMGGWLSTDRIARVRVGRLWVSTEIRELQHPAQFCAPWVIDWVRGLLDAPAAPGRRRLFISRADSTTRRIVNEDAVREVLASRGFETIVPGRMSYDEQLTAFREASHVIAGHGAALAHLAASASGTHVLEMFHPLYGTWAYAMLAQACGLKYAALVGRDGVSDAPELNEPEAAGPLMGRFGHRDLRVDPDEVLAWLGATA